MKDKNLKYDSINRIIIPENFVRKISEGFNLKVKHVIFNHCNIASNLIILKDFFFSRKK